MENRKMFVIKIQIYKNLTQNNHDFVIYINSYEKSVKVSWRFIRLWTGRDRESMSLFEGNNQTVED